MGISHCSVFFFGLLIQAKLQGSYPQNILDLASDQSRYSLCDQLQVLANRASEASTDGREDSKAKMGRNGPGGSCGISLSVMVGRPTGVDEKCARGLKKQPVLLY